MPFTDAQLVLLSAASQRDDYLLLRPGRITGAALARMDAALTRSGAVEAIPVRADQPCWRVDATEAPVGLRITPAGLAAIGVETPSVEEAGSPPSMPAATVRPDTKQARLVAMLADGAPVDALGAALSWQPHTVRAALTRLRQGGLVIATRKDEQNRTVYSIEQAEPASTPAEGSKPRSADAADEIA